MVLVPLLRWWTTTYTVTNRRLITRRGILNKIGTDLPLNRIHEVSSERSLLDRMLGCGTLNVATAAEDGTVVLADVPDAEHVHTEITSCSSAPTRTPGSRRMTVRVERPAPRVAELVMDRPEARNALSTEQARRLTAAARSVAADPEVSVVVLVSALTGRVLRRGRPQGAERD